MTTPSTSMNVTRAEFRVATAQDIEDVKGNWLWRTVTYPSNLLTTGLCKILGTWEIFSNRNNVLAWDTPKLQLLGEGISALKDRVLANLGFEGYRDQLYLKTLFSFFGDRYFIDDRVIMEAFFKYHRKENSWNGTSSLNRFINLIKKMFPEETFTQEDFMFSCSKEQTQKYHSILLKLIEKNKDKFIPTIEKIASDTVEKWFETCKKTGQGINITEATRIYAAEIVAKRIFNIDCPNKEISEAMDFLSNYVVKEQAGKLTPQDELQLKTTFEVLKELAGKVLENINYFDPVDQLTNAQRKAMVIVLIFAGQETTASLLNYMIWKLARAPKDFNNIHAAIESGELQTSNRMINDYFVKSIHEFTPAYVVNRETKQDTCLECTVNGKQRKVIIDQGQSVTARISKLAENTPASSRDFNDWFAFGNAVHACPGKSLAQSEIEIFIGKLAKYEITTNQSKNIKIVGIVTSRLEEDIYIKLKERGQKQAASQF